MTRKDQVKRWIDPGSELSPRLRGVVQRAARQEVPQERLDRVEGRLAALYPEAFGDSPMEPGGGGGPASPGAGAGSTAAWRVAGPIVVLALGLGGGAWYLTRDRAPIPRSGISLPARPAPAEEGLRRTVQPASRPVRESTPEPASPPGGPPGSTRVRTPTARTPTEEARKQMRRTRSRREQLPSSFFEEVRLISAAQRVVRERPGRAMALVDEHHRRFPAGTLAQEREVLAIEALLGLGRKDAADRRAGAFRRAHPRSGYLVRIESLLAGGAGP